MGTKYVISKAKPYHTDRLMLAFVMMVLMVWFAMFIEQINRKK